MLLTHWPPFKGVGPERPSGDRPTFPGRGQHPGTKGPDLQDHPCANPHLRLIKLPFAWVVIVHLNMYHHPESNHVLSISFTEVLDLNMYFVLFMLQQSLRFWYLFESMSQCLSVWAEGRALGTLLLCDSMTQRFVNVVGSKVICQEKLPVSSFFPSTYQCDLRSIIGWLSVPIWVVWEGMRSKSVYDSRKDEASVNKCVYMSTQLKI